MQRRRLLHLLGAALLTLPCQSFGREPDPWVGTWNLNLSKSANGAESRYKKVTSQIQPWRDGLKVTYDMVGVRGGIMHMEWAGAFDGKDYPMQGLDYVMTNAYRRVDARSYEIVLKLDGALTATARVSVSPDGRTMIVETEERGASGKSSKTTAVYERQ